MKPMGMDTIDIEDFAGAVKSSVVRYLFGVIWIELIAKAPWLNLPVINFFAKKAVESVASFLAGKGGLAAFMINTGVFTTDQASDYVNTIQKQMSAPDDISDDDWEKLENEANRHFGNLWNYTR